MNIKGEREPHEVEIYAMGGLSAEEIERLKKEALNGKTKEVIMAA